MPDLLKSVSEFGFLAYQPNKNTDRLSIQLRLNGFSICISTPNESSIHYFNEYKLIDNISENNDWQNIVNAFEDWLIQEKISADQFNDISIILDTPNYTILPTAFIHKNDNQLVFNQKIDYSYRLIYNKILNFNQELIFPINKSLNTIVSEYLGNAEVYHTTSILAESIISKAKNKNSGNQVFAYVSDRNLHLLVFKGEKLVFQNCYQYTSKEDFIYFVLLIFNNQDLKTDLDYLNILGEINPSSALFNICYQYIRNVKIYNSFNIINLNNEFDSFPIHQYYIQLNAAL